MHDAQNAFTKMHGEIAGRPPALNRRDTHEHWPETITALLSTYYSDGLDPADLQYALAGLDRFTQTFMTKHGHRGIDTAAMDEAAANEVWYQWTRRRQFRRAIAALSACWASLAIERPERILDRARRIEQRRTRDEKKAAPIGSGQRQREQ